MLKKVIYYLQIFDYTNSNNFAAIVVSGGL
jgi:hypothetical protein